MNPTAHNTRINPIGHGLKRVVRGGGYSDEASYCGSTRRGGLGQNVM
jgi:hypothetical protein